MDEVSVVVRGTNLSSTEWVPEDNAILNLPLDGSEGGLFTGNFVPPPPRPLFLDETATPDGLTTCDLCSWAWQNSNVYQVDSNLESPGEVGWVLTLVIVSLISAVVGAIVMIIVLHCKRLKNTEQDRRPPNPTLSSNIRPPICIPDDKSVNTISGPNFPNSSTTNINGVWSWLSRRATTSPSQLDNPSTTFVENHYTHIEDAYNSVGDALYAKLEMDSSVDRDSNNDSPAYQNSAYTDPDAPTSSAPSSAYYSDLSITTMSPGERAYEVVGLATMPSTWECGGSNRNRLAAISENSTVPSDYV